MKTKTLCIALVLITAVAVAAWFQERKANHDMYVEIKQLKQKNAALVAENTVLKQDLADAEALFSSKGIGDIIDDTTTNLKNNFDSLSDTLRDEFETVADDLLKAKKELEKSFMQMLPDSATDDGEFPPDADAPLDDKNDDQEAEEPATDKKQLKAT